MQGFLLIMVIGCIVTFVGYKIECWNDEKKEQQQVGTKKIKNESIDRSVNLVLNTLEEGAIFSKGRSWMIQKIDIMHFDGDISVYAYMLVEEYISLRDVEIMIKEANFDWEPISDDDGRIWLRKIATFGDDRRFIKPLKARIVQKHPGWTVDTSCRGQIYARIWL